MWRAVGLGLGLTAAVAGPAYGSCSGARFETCASIVVTTHYDARLGVTFVDFIIRNLGEADDASIFAIYFENASTTKQLLGNDPTPNRSAFLGYSARGAVGHSPACQLADLSLCDPLDDAWDTHCDPTRFAICWPDKYDTFPNIIGCTADPAPTFYPGAVQTCDALGYTGSVVFSFSLEGHWRSRDLAIHMEPNTGNGVCGVRPSGLAGDLPLCPGAAAVTPEPATWSLTGLGLLAMGLAGYRRSYKLPA